jgi:hypothetical protein
MISEVSVSDFSKSGVANDRFAAKVAVKLKNRETCTLLQTVCTSVKRQWETRNAEWENEK